MFSLCLQFVLINLMFYVHYWFPFLFIIYIIFLFHIPINVFYLFRNCVPIIILLCCVEVVYCYLRFQG
jgi:hypothetical protein